MCLFSFLPIAVDAYNNKQVLHVRRTDGSSLEAKKICVIFRFFTVLCVRVRSFPVLCVRVRANRCYM